MKARRAHRCRLAVTLTLAMALGGCATAPPEASAPWVHAEVNRRLPPGAASNEPPAPLSDTALREALAQPLDADAAVRLALRQHPSVHARLLMNTWSKGKRSGRGGSISTCSFKAQ